MYSTAEYCNPVLLNSVHTKAVDTQLHHTMRLISGTIKSTPSKWLPVLSNIPSPHLKEGVAEMCGKPIIIYTEERSNTQTQILEHTMETWIAISQKSL